jgi:hypothetical protein
MTELLQKAFEIAKTLSDEDQDALARLFLAELNSETSWREHFSSLTQDLDPDRL